MTSYLATIATSQQNVLNSWQNHPEKLEKKDKRLGHVIHSPLHLRSSMSKNNTLQTEPLVYSSKSLFKLPP